MTANPSLRVWLIRWLYLVGIGHLAGAILMTWCADLALLTIYHQQVLDKFGLADWAEELQRWWVQLFGATLQAFSLLMLLLVYCGNRYRSGFLWGAMALILLIWAPQDAMISLQKDMLSHVWVDVAALAVLVPPLIILAIIDMRATRQE